MKTIAGMIGICFIAAGIAGCYRETPAAKAAQNVEPQTLPAPTVQTVTQVVAIVKTNTIQRVETNTVLITATNIVNLVVTNTVTGPQAAVADDAPPLITFDPLDKVITDIIPLRTISYEIVEAHCRPLLSEDGTMTYLGSRNGVLIRDTKRVVQEITEIIHQIDAPAVNIRIDVSFARTSQRNQTGAGVNIDYGDGNNGLLVIKDGKVVTPEKITVSGTARNENVTRNTMQFLVVKSGSSASLWVGKEIPDPSWLNNYRFVPTTILYGA